MEIKEMQKCMEMKTAWHASVYFSRTIISMVRDTRHRDSRICLVVLSVMLFVGEFFET